MALIDKDQIRAEIERLEGENNCGTSDFIESKRIAYKQVKEALDSLQEQPVEGLEEAAVAYSKQVSDGHNFRDLRVGFIAGAEWQYQKDRGEFAKLKAKEWSDGYNEGIAKGKEQMMDEWLKDRDGCFWDGVEEGKKAMEKQMLEEAMEGFIKRDIGGQLILGGIGAGVDEFILLDSLAFPEIHTGEYYPVKVIIVKEDDK